MCSTEDPKLIFGIDFGTTFSGISYARSDNPKGLTTICSWENALEAGNSEYAKAPSRIAYPKDPWTSTTDLLAEADYFSDDQEQREAYEGVDDKNKITWGYGVSPARLSGEVADCIEWFKLLLLDDDDAGDSIRNTERLTKAQKLIRGLGKEAIHVVADYLSLHWKHALACVERHLGKRELDELPFVIVLTVPAIWKSYTRSRMYAAAKQAGMLGSRRKGHTELHFITEPEAGTVATISDMRLNRAEVGDTFAVIDAGGGTVDLISYEIIKSEPFTIREIVEGDGGLCGAIFLDEAFEKLLRSKVGEENVSKIPKHEWTRLMDAWDSGPKKQFIQGRRAWSIDLVGAAVQVTGKRNIILSGAELQTVFDSVMPKIEEMVKRQIQGVKEATGKPPTRLILIGGFGQCKHLYYRMLALVEGGPTEVFQAPGQGPWTAISRGAVMSAMQGKLSENFARIQSRISRASYGISHWTDWEEGKYQLKDKAVSYVTGKIIAENQMKWFLKKRENSTEMQPVCLPWLRHYSLSDPSSYPRIIDDIQVYYGNETPPSRKEFGLVQKLCNINFTAMIPFDELPIETNGNGVTYRTFSYEHKYTSYGSSVDIDVYANGTRLGGKNLTIDYEDREAPRRSREKGLHVQPAISEPEQNKDDLDLMSGRDKAVIKPPPYTDVFGSPSSTPASFSPRVIPIRSLTALQGGGIAERLDSSPHSGRHVPRNSGSLFKR